MIGLRMTRPKSELNDRELRAAFERLAMFRQAHRGHMGGPMEERVRREWDALVEEFRVRGVQLSLFP